VVPGELVPDSWCHNTLAVSWASGSASAKVRGTVVWRGLRPLTPEDLPILERAAGTSGLILATGHGMSGISQGPISGKLIAQLSGGKPEIDRAPFSPDRF